MESDIVKTRKKKKRSLTAEVKIRMTDGMKRSLAKEAKQKGYRNVSDYIRYILEKRKGAKYVRLTAGEYHQLCLIENVLKDARNQDAEMRPYIYDEILRIMQKLETRLIDPQDR